jgi:hypothetical protein
LAAISRLDTKKYIPASVIAGVAIATKVAPGACRNHHNPASALTTHQPPYSKLTRA